jgi:hypothetical protein
MSRIPELMDGSDSAMFLWWKQMATAGLAFHPDDDAADVVECRTGRRVFTDEEAFEVNDIVHGGANGTPGMHANHGDLIYLAAMQATEEPEVTAARERAIADWAEADIQISPYAEVEKVSDGFWVEARIWTPG